MKAMSLTGRQKRALRQQRFVTAREARWAARMARLDYKVSGESGAMKVPNKVRTWHLGGRANGHEPPPGVAWEQSGPAHVVAVRRGQSAQAGGQPPVAGPDGGS